MGGAGGDLLEGRGGDDELIGGAGNNYADGGLGTDLCVETESNFDCES
jgi:Ca2+-binding RTX toxin-like protein